jgi:hypothetical protein
MLLFQTLQEFAYSWKGLSNIFLSKHEENAQKTRAEGKLDEVYATVEKSWRRKSLVLPAERVYNLSTHGNKTIKFISTLDKRGSWILQHKS